MRGSIACFGEVLAALRCAGWIQMGLGRFLRVLSEEEEVSEWLIPRLRGVSDWT